MDVDVAGRRPTLTLDGLWDFEFEGPRRGSTARAIRSARPGFGRPNFRRCAMRKELDAIGVASKSRRIGRTRASISSWKGCSTNW